MGRVLSWGLLSLSVLAALAPALHAQDTVLVILDEVGKVDLDQLMADGRAPNLADLARRGFVFDCAIANSVCQPTRRSIDFGDFRVQPSGLVCDVPTNKTPPVALVSLPEVTGMTSAFFGKWHEGSNPVGPWPLAPIAQGWGSFQAGVVGGTVEACGGLDYWNWVRVENGVVSSVVGVYQPSVMYARWLQWWRTSRGPRLVMYSAQLAHEPYHRPPDVWLPPNWWPISCAT